MENIGPYLPFVIVIVFCLGFISSDLTRRYQNRQFPFKNRKDDAKH